MRKWLIFFLIFSGILNNSKAQFSYKIESGLKTQLLNKFDPRSLPDFTIELTGSVRELDEEMPLPGGIDDNLRKRIDARKIAMLKEKLGNRKIINSQPTPGSRIIPKILKNTDGLPGSGTPNDNHLAVANNGKFISVMNTLIRVHNDTGKPIKAWTLSSFAVAGNKIDKIPALNRTFDPRIVYDPYVDRFIIVFMNGDSNLTSCIIVAFSSPGDPLLPWNVYKITGNPFGDRTWSDYPIVAHNKNDLFFTLNLLGNGASWEEGFREAIIWQLNKEDGYKGDTMHHNLYHDIKYNGKALRSICAIQNGPFPDGSDNYFVSVRPIDTVNDTVFMMRVEYPVNSMKTGFDMKLLKSNSLYGFPSSAMQKDASLSYRLRTNDCRVLTGIRSGNQIQYMQNSMNFKNLHAHLMHGTIYNIDSESPKIDANLYINDSLEFGYPAMAYANFNPGDPSVIITTVFSSIYHYPGMGLLYRNRYGEYSNYVKVKEGSSVIYFNYIAKDQQRWGDYEGIQAKYNEPGVFYAVGSYGKLQSMYAYITRFKVQDSVLNQPVADYRIFPIPSGNGLINIELKSTEADTYTGEIHSIIGQNVLGESRRVQFSVNEGTHIYRVNTSNLSPGIYNLRLFNGKNKKVFSQKIEIQ